MDNKITCRQIKAILPFYLKGRVNPVLCEIIEEHLAVCSVCKELYLQALSEQKKEIEIKEQPVSRFNEEQKYMTKEYINFKRKLSAYLDSELEDSENIRIKKMTISNPLARKDLEDMYNFKKLLHSSFERTMEKCKINFYPLVMKRLTEPKVSKLENFIQLVAFMALTFALVGITAFVLN